MFEERRLVCQRVLPKFGRSYDVDLGRCRPHWVRMYMAMAADACLKYQEALSCLLFAHITLLVAANAQHTCRSAGTGIFAVSYNYIFNLDSLPMRQMVAWPKTQFQIR